MRIHGRLNINRGLLAPCAGAGIVALGYALQIKDGTLAPRAIFFLTIALVLCLIGLVAQIDLKVFYPGEKQILFVLGLGLAFQLGQLLTNRPGIYLEISGASAYTPYFLGLVIAIMLAATLLWRLGWLERLRIPVLILLYLFIGAWMIKASPHPHIDVYVFQTDSAKALLTGRNPYVITFPNIYGHSQFYGEGLSDDQQVHFGFPYPPLSLFLTLPSQLLAGDYRYSQLIATALSGLLMAYMQRNRLGMIAAALFLFTPRSFFVLEQGWTEPFIVMLLSATVFLACRKSRWTIAALGLLLIIKQYMLFVLPLAFLLLPQPLPPWRSIVKMFLILAAIALIICLPLAVWDLPAFWRDVITLQLVQPFRTDALSYLSWFSQGGSVVLSGGILSFAAAILAIGIALWRAPRTPAGFAVAVAFVYCTFFAFNKQAFCNYYYFVVGAMCCTLAAVDYSEDS